MYYLTRGMIALLFAAFTLGIWMRASHESTTAARPADSAAARPADSAAASADDTAGPQTMQTDTDTTKEPEPEAKEDKSESDKKAATDQKADAEKNGKADAKKDDTKSDDADKKEDRKAKADAKDEKADKKDADKAKTYTVKEESLNVVVALDGVVESKRNTEVFIDPKTWSDWVVESAVSQGTAVKKGDKLVEFDTVKIDEEIRDEEANRKLAELSLEQTTAEIRLRERSMPVELQVAERASRLADADLDLYLKEDRQLLQRQADFQVKMIGNVLEYQREELKQLEKMYKADDLTEETEEIILKRTRDEVEQYEFMNELAKIRRDRLVKVELPRQEDELKEQVNETTVALQKAQTTLPISLDKLRLELEKAKFERKKASEKLERLENDRKLMTVTAPADGLVYYGACDQGQWKQATAMANKLRKGGHISADEVFMTIVDPDSLIVRATVPEKDLWQVRRGMTGSAVLEGAGQERLPASIDSLKTTPSPDASFLATVLVDWGRLPSELPPPVPGMDCTVKINVYNKDKVLTLPAKAVHTDAQKNDERYVWLKPSPDKSGPDKSSNGKPGEAKPVRRKVTVGRTMEDLVEITDGLSAGDKVLREKPEDEE